MNRLLLAILGLGFALALSSSWDGSKEEPVDEVNHYAIIAKSERPQRHYSRKW